MRTFVVVVVVPSRCICRRSQFLLSPASTLYVVSSTVAPATSTVSACAVTVFAAAAIFLKFWPWRTMFTSSRIDAAAAVTVSLSKRDTESSEAVVPCGVR